MSIHFKRRRVMAPDIAARKGGEPIVALTAYHAHTAAIADNHCDFLLVGDSLGMVMHGLRDDRSGAARIDDHARPRRRARLETRPRRHRHAFRHL